MAKSKAYCERCCFAGLRRPPSRCERRPAPPPGEWKSAKEPGNRQGHRPSIIPLRALAWSPGAAAASSEHSSLLLSPDAYSFSLAIDNGVPSHCVFSGYLTARGNTKR
jgi:hypothetical protein